MGMPRLRQAYTPHPVVDQSAAHLRAYIDRSDAISGRPFMQEVLEGLTSPLEDADLEGLSFERTTPRLMEPDTEDNLHRLFTENRWTDMLPIVLPTEARVEAMLRQADVALYSAKAQGRNCVAVAEAPFDMQAGEGSVAVPMDERASGAGRTSAAA